MGTRKSLLDRGCDCGDSYTNLRLFTRSQYHDPCVIKHKLSVNPVTEQPIPLHQLIKTLKQFTANIDNV